MSTKALDVSLIRHNQSLIGDFWAWHDWFCIIRLRMSYILRHEKWTFLLPVLCLCNLKSDWHITAMSQRATIELRVLHAGLMCSTSFICTLKNSALYLRVISMSYCCKSWQLFEPNVRNYFGLIVDKHCFILWLKLIFCLYIEPIRKAYPNPKFVFLSVTAPPYISRDCFCRPCHQGHQYRQ